VKDLPYLCPRCLTELPAGYPYDHVAVDYALAGNHAVYTAMGQAERREVVHAGRAQGLSDNAIGIRVGRNRTHIRRLMGGRIKNRLSPERLAEIDEQVRTLWEQRLTDAAISRHVGVKGEQVVRSRYRQGLPALFGPGGKPLDRQQVAA
jgi:hypothetical protein